LYASKKKGEEGLSQDECLIKLLTNANELPEKKKAKSDKGVFGRLTDTKNYGGVYGQRFDEDGKGKGLEGGDSDRVAGIKKVDGIRAGDGGNKVTNIADTLRSDE